MYFTREQTRALWFIIIVFALAVAGHYVKYYFFPPAAADFSEFQKKFVEKRRQILSAAAEDSLSADSRARSGTAAPTKAVGSPANRTSAVNINRADRQALETLPRIGPAMARRIIEYRQRHGPFRKKEEIMRVRGIGPKTFEKLKPLITVAP